MDQEKLTPQIREDLVDLSPLEALEVLKNEGVELSDKDLEAVSGGWEDDWGLVECSDCHSLTYIAKPKTETTCNGCGKTLRVQW